MQQTARVLLGAFAFFVAGCGGSEEAGLFGSTTVPTADSGLEDDARGANDSGTGTDGNVDTVADDGSQTESGPPLPAACNGRVGIAVQRIYDEVAYLVAENLQGRKAGSHGNRTAVDHVESLFRDLGLVPKGINGTYRQGFAYNDRHGVRITADNLLGALQGTDPNLMTNVLVVGAHIDHLGTDNTGHYYPGADDNASGVAVVEELARAMVCGGLTPARTVLLAIWNGEEDGDVGSCFFVSHPTYALSSTTSAFSLDMVGGGDGKGMLIYQGTEQINSWLVKLTTNSAAAQGLSQYAVVPAALPNNVSSDHKCFGDQGLPSVLWMTTPMMRMLGGTTDGHPYYHTINDTIDHVLKDDLEAAIRLALATVQPLALGTEQQFLK